ncbi:hypothetical protein BGZ65_001909 [Modicella reniformis]|uniref:BZIP domain-containing protein n=1 Tax=Modicella reniformis TaxID=1440133 RepID=A0A9P6LSB0_9FUNG|nr:hypothetical protein BGZ65_001909 [Modicella reniformis]
MSASPPPSSSSATCTLSATDRRERNKAASAKYRAKKHSQSGEMRSQISTLQDHNNVLTRQLEESRAENTSLKNLVEKLKGRLVAEKVLKRLREVGREKNKRSNTNSSSNSSNAALVMLSDSETDDVEDQVVHAATADLEEDFEDVMSDDDDDDDEEEEEKENHRQQKAKGQVRRPKSNSRRTAA